MLLVDRRLWKIINGHVNMGINTGSDEKKCDHLQGPPLE